MKECGAPPPEGMTTIRRCWVACFGQEGLESTGEGIISDIAGGSKQKRKDLLSLKRIELGNVLLGQD